MTIGTELGDRTDLCRLTILADRTQVDLALPAGAPLALLIPEVVALVDSESTDLHERPASPAEWTLGRLGHAPLDPAGSFASHRIVDGELLLLQRADRSAPPPLFDDLMHNVASIDAGTFRRWNSAAARVAGSATTITASLVGGLAALCARDGDSALVAMIVSLVVAILFTAAGIAAARVYDDTRAGTTLWASALAPAFAGGALIVPASPGGSLAPAVLLGSVVCGAVAVLATRMSGAGSPLAVTVATAAILAAASSGVAIATDLSASEIGGVVTAAALVLLAVAPRIAMLLAKLPLPPVPSPGSPLDPDEPDGTDTAAPPPSFADLAAKAGRARGYLTGLVAAAAGSATVGALLAAGGLGATRWAGVALAVVTALVLALRGRGYATLSQASALVGSAVVLVVVMVGGIAVHEPRWAPLVIAVTAIGGAVAFVLGSVAPHRDFSPVQRRAVELVDYAAIAAILPLACWVAGLFEAMRGL